MYIVTLHNGNIKTEIHGLEEKLKNGSVVQGINSIDSFSFTLLPSNVGFNLIRDFQTLVNVFNTNTNEYEFQGRVLYSRVAMEESGLITKEIVCESYMGFLNDSVQLYAEEQNWTVRGLLQHILDCHNSQVEEYKHISIGELDVEDPNDNLFVGLQRENTWSAIQEKLIEKLGGEIRLRVVDGELFLDYLQEIGATVSTEIALSKNMKAIAREHDPSSYVTRLIPYGCKLSREETDAEGNVQTVETEERLDISSVNGGKIYIDSADGIEAYGIHTGVVEFDDVTEASNLLSKGRQWLIDNNKLQVKYSITALDLSLLGLDIHSFKVHNRHPIKNALISIDDTARIIKKTLDIVEELQSTIEVGDNFKTLSDIQRDEAGKVDQLIDTVGKVETITNNFVHTNSFLKYSDIVRTCEEITLGIVAGYTSADDLEAYKQEIKNTFSITEKGFDYTFLQLEEKLNGEIAEREEYIRFVDGEIHIGRSGSPVTSVYKNDSLEFRFNGVPVATFANDRLEVENVAVGKQVSFYGEWAIRKGAKIEGVGYNLNDVWIGG